MLETIDHDENASCGRECFELESTLTFDAAPDANCPIRFDSRRVVKK